VNEKLHYDVHERWGSLHMTRRGTRTSLTCQWSLSQVRTRLLAIYICLLHPPEWPMIHEQPMCINMTTLWTMQNEAGNWFRFWPVHQLSQFKFSWLSSVSPSKYWDNSMKYITFILFKIPAHSNFRIIFPSL
jgi:hypothetical protein